MINTRRLLSAIWTIQRVWAASGDDENFTMGVSFPEVYNEEKQVPVFTGRVERDALFEYYDFSALPLCDFTGIETVKLSTIEGTLGSSLAGHSWTFNPRIPIIWGQNLEDTTVCKLSVTTDVMREAGTLIASGGKVTYWIDGLPTVAYVGLQRSGIDYLFKHRHFDIYTQADKIVAVEAAPSEPQQLILNSRMELTYSVKFTSLDQADLTDLEPLNDHRTRDRYRRYLSSSSVDQANRRKIDTHNLINVTGVCCIVTCLAAIIFQRFLASRKPGSDEESPWSVTARLPNIWMLRNQIYRRPIHVILISIAVAIGTQSITAFLATWVYTSLGMTISERVFRQLDGRFLDVLLWSFVGSSIVGGFAGGAFIKQWGVRRTVLAFVAQTIIPFVVMSIVLIQYRTLSMITGTTLIIPLASFAELMGMGLFDIGCHFIGFQIGMTMVSTLEMKPPSSDLDQIPQVAEAPPEGRFKRAILLSVPGIMVNAITCGPLFVSLRCLMSSFCVQSEVDYLFLHVLLAGVSLASMVIIVTYLLLCLGDGRWQWNAFRIGLVHGICQTVCIALWSVRSYAPSTLYGSVCSTGVNLILGAFTSCASTSVAYYSGSTVLSTIFDDRKAE